MILSGHNLEHTRKSTVSNQIRLYIVTLALVAIAIAIGGTRERQSVASPKLRYTTDLPDNWLDKYNTGSPPSTPVLYCGNKADKGYYKLNTAFTAYDASADDLCEFIPIWRWVGSKTLSWLFSIILVVQFIFRNIVLNTPKAKKRTIALVIILVTRFVIFKIIDEPKGSASDASDHVFVQSVFIWALLWDVWSSLIYPNKGRLRLFMFLWDAFWIVAFLVSLGITSGIYHTSDEMWEGFKQSAFFLAVAGLIAYYYTKENDPRGRYTKENDPRGRYNNVSSNEIVSEVNEGIKTQDIENKPLHF